MRSSPFISLLLGAFAMLACGARSPRVDAAPRAGHAAPQAALPASDKPLIAGELKDLGDVARALHEHYVKYDYRIPMRDGVKLFTSVYVPKDASRTYPIMLERTPYGIGPYGVDNSPSEKNPRSVRAVAPSPAFVRDGFIFAQQDVRGRMMSEGTFVDVRPHRTGNGKTDVDESTDAWDTIDWLVKNVPNNNGRVGTWGISYPGFYAAQSAVDAHPALKAVSPQAPVTEWFLGDDFHHNGAFFVADAFDFYANFGRAREQLTTKWSWDFETDGDIYDFFLRMGPLANANDKWLKGKIAFWNELMQHGTRDAFWQARDPRPHYKDAKPAIMTVGGWFDAEDLYGALETYRAFEAKSPHAENVLVMGPWNHGGWARTEGERLGDIGFGAKTSHWYQDNVELPFFQRHLKGRSSAPAPEAWIFDTGIDVWRAYASWPPKEAKSQALYFHANHGLGAATPAAREDETGADAFVSDPAKPVPYDAHSSQGLDHDYIIEDQRFAARRPDVLVYQTPPLDDAVTLAGPIVADLYVTTTGTDADFVVKVIDVFPDSAEDPHPGGAHGAVHMAGYQMLVRAEVMRGKFRHGFDKPEPFRPGESTNVRFTLPDVAHTFRAGHRIMVQVQSSWFPLVDRNPQTFVDIYQAKESDFRAQTHRVIRTPDRPSSIRVSVLRGRL